MRKTWASRRPRGRRWLPSGRLARRSRGLLLGGVALRCITWWGVPALDRKLAAGADPMQSDALSLRVGQLRSAKTRRRLAAAIHGVVALAERDAYPVGLAVPPFRRAAVRASRGRLLETAERLRRCEPVGVRGIAIAAQLIQDRRGPLYRDIPERPFSVAVAEVLVGLDRGARTISAPDS